MESSTVIGDRMMDSTGASGAISRKDIAKMEAHAELYYNEIRKRESDIEAISHNTGFSKENIALIKKHIFFNEYDLGKKNLSRFDPSYDIAISWQRLQEGKNIQEMDIVLLNHELMEFRLMEEQGLNYRQAHELAETKYNYSKYIKELDEKEGVF